MLKLSPQTDIQDAFHLGYEAGRSGMSPQEAVADLSNDLTVAQAADLLKAWNDLTPAQHKAWDRAAEREQRRLARESRRLHHDHVRD